MSETSKPTPNSLVRGEFHTDGAGFVFTLSDTPFSGYGKTAEDAYDDLMQSIDEAGDLPERLRDLAKDQASAAERASLIRLAGIFLIALTVAGGLLGGAMALAPQVVADISQTLNDQSAAPS